MFYYMYKITNDINNKIYIGIHKSKSMQDDYMGSGKIIKQAIEKYGIDHFKKEVVETFDTWDDALLREKEIVNEDFLLREDVYNIKLGGSGGWDYIVKNDLHKNGLSKDPWNKGKKLPPVSEDVKKRTSDTLKTYWKENPHPRKGTNPWNKGKKGIQVPWNKGIEQPKYPCPHCGKNVNTLNYKKWHGDKCKHKNTLDNV